MNTWLQAFRPASPSRRDFLLTSAGALGVALVRGGRLQAAQEAAPRITTTDLGGITLFQGAGCNVLALAGPDGAAWRDAALAAAGSLGVSLDAYVAGGDPGLSDPDRCFPAAYGISPSGAVLVRPDGFTGWRAASLADDPQRVLQAALESLLCRDDGTP